MVDLECGDVISEYNSGEVKENHEDPDSNHVELKSCCFCSSVIPQDEEVFDIDSCSHCVCVSCRFQDDIKCRICNPVEETIKKPPDDKLKDTDNDLLSLDYLMYSSNRRKRLNKEHIIDMECEGKVQKQMCTVCQRVFKKTNARYHYACLSGEKPFVCVECGQKFVKKSHMEAHMNRHYGIKPFKCTVHKCKASFTQKDKLTRHMKIHDKDKKHTCRICGKAYTSQPILNLHLNKVHSSLKPFQCEMCPRSYKYKKSLKIHRLKHQAKRDFMCEVCGKKYALFSQLKQHKRSHVPYKRRPYKCRCEQQFMTRRDKARHEVIHTQSHDFECSICKTIFGRKDNLERHMKNFHQYPPALGNTGKLTAVVKPFNKNVLNEVNYTIKKNDNAKETQETTNAKVKSNRKNKNSNDKKTDLGTFKIRKNKVTGIKDYNSEIIKIEILNLNKRSDEHIETNNNQSVIVSPKLAEEQNRPSVIKSIPKLLPYQVLPPDKRFLKMTEEIAKGKCPSELMPPPAGKMKTGNKINTSAKSVKMNKVPSMLELLTGQSNVPIRSKLSTPLNEEQYIPKDNPLKRCVQIICHTNSINTELVPTQNISRRNIAKLEDDLNAKFTIQSNIKVDLAKKSKKQIHFIGTRPYTSAPINGNYAQQIETTTISNSINTLHKSRASEESKMYPMSYHNLLQCKHNLSSSYTILNPHNSCDITQEYNSTNSFVPLSESPYTPYFDNISHYSGGSGEQSLPNELDVGFQYINGQLGCADINCEGSATVRYVPQETRVMRESFS